MASWFDRIADAPPETVRAEIAERVRESADLNAADAEGYTPLALAVLDDRYVVAEALLEAGADPNLPNEHGFAPGWNAGTHAMAELLIRHGAGPETLDRDTLREIIGADRIPEQPVSPAEFARARNPREGRTNPEEVREPFWEQMIRTGHNAYLGHETFGPGERPSDIPAVWCHERFGMSTTALPDGRWVQVAGEHEDYYDQDFHIYNDVVVHDGRGGLRHFLYPEAVFPPTDFHSATLVGERILLIGSLSYGHCRRPGETQVLSLSLADFSIAPVTTQGAGPGWINRHRAHLTEDGIEIRGGKVWTGEDLVPLKGRWRLSLPGMRWTRL